MTSQPVSNSFARIHSDAALLLLFNLSAGGLNYLFQIRAAHRLPGIAYGSLNTWLAITGIVLSLGTLSQYLMVFMPDSRSTRVKTFYALGTLFCLGLLSFGLSVLQTTASLFWLGVSTLFFGIAFYLVFGKLQQRRRYLLLGCLTFLLALTKILVTFISPAGRPEDHMYFLALPLSFALCAVAFLLFLNPFKASLEKSIHVNKFSLRPLGGPLLLAVAYSLMPQFDLLLLRALHDPASVGTFSKASLFAKAIFFSVLTLLQVSLPKYIEFAKSKTLAQEIRHLQRLELFGIIFCVLGSFFFYATGPFLSEHFLNINLLEQRSWILLSCLNLSCLYATLRHIQILCSFDKLRQSAWRLLAFMIFAIVILVVRPATIEHLLMMSGIFYFALGSHSMFATRRLLRNYSPDLRLRN